VIDNLAKLVPEHIEKVVEVTNLLVRQPKVEAYIFAVQDQSLRAILVAGKASAAPQTAATVREIVSYLASGGNPNFLDLDN
jgi:ribosomal protein L12E/L44/L45/RPP1/RPP2